MAGLLLTHWWQRRELGLVGAKAPPSEFVIPRPAGAIVGVLALAVLGFGVAFLLKGLRYLVFKPTLAQLKWSDWFGVAPRTVGVIFAVGGFAVAILGGWLFRFARALGRAGTKRKLELDPRPAALYLRSFQDDNLPLPAIASARRPLFELFSVRGSDPFEESMAWELNSYGPVVAVGRPGRSLASLGAAREHLSRRDLAGAGGGSHGRSGDHRRRHRRDRRARLGARPSGQRRAHRQDVLRVPACCAGRARPAMGPHGGIARAGPGGRAAARTGRGSTPCGSTPTARATVTFARRRDEATYRTAVDRCVDRSPATSSSDVSPQPGR